MLSNIHGTEWVNIIFDVVAIHFILLLSSDKLSLSVKQIWEVVEISFLVFQVYRVSPSV